MSPNPNRTAFHWQKAWTDVMREVVVTFIRVLRGVLISQLNPASLPVGAGASNVGVRTSTARVLSELQGWLSPTRPHSQQPNNLRPATISQNHLQSFLPKSNWLVGIGCHKKHPWFQKCERVIWQFYKAYHRPLNAIFLPDLEKSKTSCNCVTFSAYRVLLRNKMSYGTLYVETCNCKIKGNHIKHKV